MPAPPSIHTHTIVEDICRVIEVVGIFSFTNPKTAHAIPQAFYRVTEGEAILSCVYVLFQKPALELHEGDAILSKQAYGSLMC